MISIQYAGSTVTIVFGTGGFEITMPTPDFCELAEACRRRQHLRSHLLRLEFRDHQAHLSDAGGNTIELTHHDIHHITALAPTLTGASAGAYAIMQGLRVEMHTHRIGDDHFCSLHMLEGSNLWSFSDLLELRAMIDKFVSHYLEGRGRML
jgi:hypothetical protein